MPKKIIKNPFKESELRLINEMISANGDSKIVAEKIGITQNSINQRFYGLRKKYEKARIIVNTYEAWRRNPSLRKRLF